MNVNQDRCGATEPKACHEQSLTIRNKNFRVMIAIDLGIQYNVYIGTNTLRLKPKEIQSHVSLGHICSLGHIRSRCHVFGDSLDTIQKATLARLLATYRTNVHNGQSAAQLQSLAQQIANLAISLDRIVELPFPGATSAASSSGVTGMIEANQGGMSKTPAWICLEAAGSPVGQMVTGKWRTIPFRPASITTDMLVAVSMSKKLN